MGKVFFSTNKQQWIERVPAELVWSEYGHTGNRWTGRLVNEYDAVDLEPGFEYATPAADKWGANYSASIVSHTSERGTSYELITQGRDRGGRRHRGFATLTEAQQAGIAWAKRRFAVEYPCGTVTCTHCGGKGRIEHINCLWMRDPCSHCEGRGSFPCTNVNVELLAADRAARKAAKARAKVLKAKLASARAK